LKEAFPGKGVLWADFTNGAHNYVPTREALARGGYETEHGRFEADAGEKILATGMTLFGELFEMKP